MATAKRNAKSSKTAHVLNLLAPGGENETIRPPAVSQAEPSAAPGEDALDAAVPAEAAVSRPLAPPILEVARSNDEQVSLQIKDALESELLSALGDMPGSALAEPQAVFASEPESEPEPEPEPEPETEPDTETAREPDTAT